MDRAASAPQPGDHAAIVYSDSNEAADFCVRYVREGIGLGELVVGIVPRALGLARAPAVEPPSAPAGARGSRDRLRRLRPTRADRLVRGRRGACRTARTGAGGTGRRLRRAIPIEDWRLFEQLIHERAHALGVTALCVYDGPLLPGDFIPVAMRAHPLLVRRNGELRRNGEFRWEKP